MSDALETPEERRERMRELGRRGGLAKAQKEAEEADPRAILKEIASNKRFPAYARTQAAKALAALPDEVEELGWRASVQVRPDFEPPNWDEVLVVARAAGAIE